MLRKESTCARVSQHNITFTLPLHPFRLPVVIKVKLHAERFELMFINSQCQCSRILIFLLRDCLTVAIRSCLVFDCDETIHNAAYVDR